MVKLVIAEPDVAMRRRLERRLRGYGIPTRVISARAEQLPCEPGSFNCVVATLVLCSTADPALALAEVRAALKPGGRLLFIEHVRSEDPMVARWQDLMRVPWALLGRGCQCNRSTVEQVRAAGFTVTALQREMLPMVPAIVKPVVIGTAIRG